ncbi:MAG: hypothetical protein JW929_04000 [Anaerolineales bacterium]|nr:hypothetical protein [Anaerolineales bacterium]
MKKMKSCLWIVLLSIAALKPVIVYAEEDITCEEYPVAVKFPGDEQQYGFAVTGAKKISPEYPIVIGQDMEEKTGVDLTVEVSSLPMTVTYWAPVEVMECVEDKNRKGYDDDCPPQYFMTKVRKCVEVKDEPVRRTIIGASLQVWLEPAEVTRKWLGWSTDDDNHYPLRYVFPEKWALGTWTPEGFTTVGSDFMFTEAQIDAIIAQNPGFEFLKGDPRAEDIPTYALTRVQDPTTDAARAQRVLALYGEFTNWYTGAPTTADGPCLVDNRITDGYCQTATNLSMTTPETELFNADLNAEGITYIRLDLRQVPMDLPGEWFIGVSVKVNPAKYYHETRTEPSPANLHMDTGNGYRKDNSKFTVYILISTLCNSAEVDGCTM